MIRLNLHPLSTTKDSSDLIVKLALGIDSSEAERMKAYELLFDEVVEMGAEDVRVRENEDDMNPGEGNDVESRQLEIVYEVSRK